MAAKRTFLLAAVLVMTAAPALGDSGTAARTDTVYVLAPVVVRAPKPVTTAGGATAIAASVDSLPLSAAPALDDVLRELPMLRVRTNSRGETEISSRGSESRHVALLLDGVPLSLAWDGRADASVIPATAIERLVYTRGLSSMLYGPNVLAGVVDADVNAWVQRNQRRTKITGAIEDTGGSATAITTTIPVETRGGTWVVRAGFGLRDTPGQRLARGVSEPVQSGSDLRQNTDATSRDGFLSVRHRSDGGAWLSLFGSACRVERGLAAELGVGEARFWRYPHVSRALALLASGSGERASPFGGHGSIAASLGVQRGRTEIDRYASREYDHIDAFEDGEDRTLTLRLNGEQTLGSRGELEGVFTVADIQHLEIVPDGEFDYAQRLWSLGGESAWWLVQRGGHVNTMRLSLGGAYDVGETPEAGGREPLGRISSWGARAGVSMGVFGGSALVHAGISRRGRFPSLRELYSGSLGRFAPNPNLQPEKLVAIEAGITAQVGRGTAQVAGFQHRLDDAVVRILLDDGRFMRVNRHELRSTGLEFLLTQGVGAVNVAADFTLQNVELRDARGAVENSRPENVPEAFGGLNAEFPLFLGLRAYTEVAYTGSQFCIDPGTGADAELHGGAILGGHISRSWRTQGLLSRFETRLSIDNATDAALYDQFGLPRPGRLVRLEFHLERF